MGQKCAGNITILQTFNIFQVDPWRLESWIFVRLQQWKQNSPENSPTMTMGFRNFIRPIDFTITCTFGMTCHTSHWFIPVQIGPEGLGAPFCSYRKASPRCPSYKLAEPNVHRGRFLLQNGSPSWPLVTKWVTDFARLASARIRWLDLPFTEWWGLGVAILALS